MSGPGLFADLDKPVTDLLNENFPVKPKVEFNTAVNANGVNLQVTGVRNDNNSVVGTFIPKCTYAPWGLVAKGTVDTNQTFKMDLAVSDKLTKGLRTQLIGTFGLSQSAKVNAEYRHEVLGASSSFEYAPGKASKLAASLTLLYKKFVTGVAVDYSLGSNGGVLTSAKGAVYFKDKDFSVAGVVKNAGEDLAVGGNWYQNVTSTNAVGADVSYDLRKSALNLAVGYKHLLDNNVVLKLKVDSNGKAAASAQTQINRNVGLILGAEVYVQGVSSGKDNKFGFQITFNA
jgi:hypothetical protein